jgi:NAD dependent epimerase/dehydratase family enzyme
MKNRKIILAGGTGFIGQGLIRYFGRDNPIVVFSRLAGKHKNNLGNKRLLTQADGYEVQYIDWNGRETNERCIRELEGSDLLINLAGKSVNCRYHRKQKEAIMSSRVESTRALATAIRRLSQPPSLWINAASATIYRDTYDRPNDEYNGLISDWKNNNMPYNLIDRIRSRKQRLFHNLFHTTGQAAYMNPDLDFSVQVCKAWESVFSDEPLPLTRKLVLRTAIVLGQGGVMDPFLRLSRSGLGGRLGTGRQLFSWIHEEDLARMIAWLFDNTKQGIYNCASPNAVTNSDFMKLVRQVSGQSFGIPAPACLLEVGAWLIGTETELLLKSRWVTPRKALDEGFQFKFPHLEDALRQIINSR